MKLIRGWMYGPLWAVVLVVAAIQSAYVAAVGLGWFGAVMVLISLPIFAFSIASARKRYGGRHEMRRFYEAVRTRQLPILTSPEEVVRWNQLIIRERESRRGAFAATWIQLAVGVLLLVILAVNTLSGLSPDFASPMLAAIMIGGFISTRTANPRALASLAAMAEQGTDRGYGYSLPAH
ncbi:hypothetical protein [Nocardia sp. NPDC004722]